MLIIALTGSLPSCQIHPEYIVRYPLYPSDRISNSAFEYCFAYSVKLMAFPEKSPSQTILSKINILQSSMSISVKSISPV